MECVATGRAYHQQLSETRQLARTIGKVRLLQHHGATALDVVDDAHGAAEYLLQIGQPAGRVDVREPVVLVGARGVVDRLAELREALAQRTDGGKLEVLELGVGVDVALRLGAAIDNVPTYARQREPVCVCVWCVCVCVRVCLQVRTVCGSG